MAGQAGTGGERKRAVRADSPAGERRESPDAAEAAGTALSQWE